MYCVPYKVTDFLNFYYAIRSSILDLVGVRHTWPSVIPLIKGPKIGFKLFKVLCPYTFLALKFHMGCSSTFLKDFSIFLSPLR